MTEAFFVRQYANCNDDSSGGESKVARVSAHPTKPVSSSGKRATPSA